MRIFDRKYRLDVLVVVATLAASAVLLPSDVQAQANWPNRPIKMIVPFDAGVGNDVIARSLGPKLAARLGQAVVVENRAGAGGSIGTDAAAKSPPDGNTLLFVSVGIVTNAASGKKLPYNIKRDLTSVGQIGTTPLLIVVSNSSGIKTLGELINLARAKPFSVNYGSSGVGATNHIGMELFATEAKIQLTHVPYKSFATAFTDLLAGNLQAALSSLASASKLIQAGKVRAVAVTSLQRSPFMPDLPTATEGGLPGFQIESWWGMLAPARTPSAVIRRLNEELNVVVVQPDIREMLERQAAVPKAGTPEEFATLISFELERWSKLIKDANIQME